jgi:hypothetical protein
MEEPRAPRSLAELAGWQVDDRSPALVVLSARELNQAAIEDLVRLGAEDRALLEGAGPALEVIFSLSGEPGPWVWRLRLHEDDVPEDEPGEYFAEELTWRLVEWRDTRQQQRQSAAAPRLLRAS